MSNSVIVKLWYYARIVWGISLLMAGSVNAFSSAAHAAAPMPVFALPHVETQTQNQTPALAVTSPLPDASVQQQQIDSGRQEKQPKESNQFSDMAFDVGRGAIITGATVLAGPVGGAVALVATNLAQQEYEVANGQTFSWNEMLTRLMGDSTAIIGGTLAKMAVTAPFVANIAPSVAKFVPQVIAGGVDGIGSAAQTMVTSLHEGKSLKEASQTAALNGIASAGFSGGAGWIAETGLVKKAGGAFVEGITKQRQQWLQDALDSTLIKRTHAIPTEFKSLFKDKLGLTDKYFTIEDLLQKSSKQEGYLPFLTGWGVNLNFPTEIGKKNYYIFGVTPGKTMQEIDHKHWLPRQVTILVEKGGEATLRLGPRDIPSNNALNSYKGAEIVFSEGLYSVNLEKEVVHAFSGNNHSLFMSVHPDDAYEAQKLGIAVEGNRDLLGDLTRPLEHIDIRKVKFEKFNFEDVSPV
jgi:hypothetical protein